MSAPTRDIIAGATSVDARGGSVPEPIARFTGREASSTRTLILAIELGVLADYLMRANALGVNITLWCWALLGAAWMATASADVPIDRRRLALVGATAFFAAVPAWRTSEMLVFLSGVAVLMLLVLSAWVSGSPAFALAQRALGSYIRAAATGFVHIIIGAVPLLAAQARARAELRNTYRRPLGSAVRGALLCVPVVLVLGTLLMQADAGYERLVSGIFRWDAGTVISHLLLAGVFTWLAAAYMCASLHWERDALVRPWSIRLGIIEGSMVLGVVNLLFLSFMVVQLGYLFGGTEHVLTTAGLTLAEYARRGFFELVAVTALTLPLMVGLTAAVTPETPRERRIQRGLTATLVVLLLALVASALGRMRLYELEFGWTLDRVHASVLMFWIAGTIVWFATTVLRGDARRFAFGSLMGGLATLAALAAVNPAALIVRANAARVASGADFDGEHAVRLGADAFPELMRQLPVVAPALDAKERCAVQRAVENFTSPSAEDDAIDWRGWNLARTRAHASARAHAAGALRTLGAASCDVQVAPAAEAAPGAVTR